MNWRALYSEYKRGNVIPGISLEALLFYDTVKQPCYRVTENTGEYKFDMLRLQQSGRKITYFDDLGLVGCHLLDLQVNHCYLTEGVSDFMSGYLYMRMEGSPISKSNILGVTTLSGNEVAHAILYSLFDSYTIITDNDATGYSNAVHFRKMLQSWGKEVTIYKPEAGCKDLSAQFMQELMFKGLFKANEVYY